MSLAYLRVKIKSLAAEQAIIRHEERRHLRQGRWHLRRQHHADGAATVRYATFNSLRDHRLGLRGEIRSALLAYGYLRGRGYRRIEPSAYDVPNLKRTGELVVKYGPRGVVKDTAQKDLEAWMKAA